jgi:hypothetical protein
MLGRKDFTADEIAAARYAVTHALKAFADAGSPASLETVFFNVRCSLSTAASCTG